MLTLNIIIFLVVTFLGYTIGRWIDYINILMKDPPWLPHHWIPGVILMAIAFFYFKDIWELSIYSFGFGLFISDYKDFIELKLFARDKKTKNKWRFWNID